MVTTLLRHYLPWPSSIFPRLLYWLARIDVSYSWKWMSQSLDFCMLPETIEKYCCDPLQHLIITEIPGWSNYICGHILLRWITPTIQDVLWPLYVFTYRLNHLTRLAPILDARKRRRSDRLMEVFPACKMILSCGMLSDWFVHMFGVSLQDFIVWSRIQSDAATIFGALFKIPYEYFVPRMKKPPDGLITGSVVLLMTSCIHTVMFFYALSRNIA